MFCYSYARVSSRHQVDKHGITRQVKAARVWAERNGHELIEISDKGLSAYTGKHTQKGNLGKFIAAVGAGEIPAGSILIVEALDRLSRQDILTQLNQFINLLDNDIEIVTLSDGMHFTKKSVGDNWAELIISIAMMVKGNDESKLKGQRIKSARENSHNKADQGQHIITRQVPFWCEIKNNTVIENHHAAAVRRMFELSLEGKGAITIARKLNEESVPCYTGARKSKHNWNMQKVHRVLKNPATYGLFVPEGDYQEKENYYPQVISKTDFMTVQGLIEKRRKNKVKSASPNNLFSGVLKCQCGSHYSFGTSKTGRFEGSQRFLKCNRKTFGEKCENPRLWYFPFEKLMLSSVLELQYHKQAGTIDETIAMKAEIERLEQQNQNLVDLIIAGNGSELMAKKSKEIEEAISKIKWDIFTYRHKKSISPNLAYKQDEIVEIQDLKNADLRESVQNQILSVVEEVIVFPEHFKVNLSNGLTYEITPKEKNSSKLANKSLTSNKRLF
ncbi:recombinase family protein [Corallincola holothuriorum]|uniref:Recombinase family protein n=1 Tax=Corallincola holothuriorum TaxID=2282215 RepID=A0A368NF10_9GAMM|nr:recombinase family protein [Corallincola holothuriorum]RCU49162.1 recombinase family protein [Corallincola holothuriorum]